MDALDEQMTTADWRWAAKKGYWNHVSRTWNEQLGGKRGYIFQRNFWRSARFGKSGGTEIWNKKSTFENKCVTRMKKIHHENGLCFTPNSSFVLQAQNVFRVNWTFGYNFVSVVRDIQQQLHERYRTAFFESIVACNQALLDLSLETGVMDDVDDNVAYHGIESSGTVGQGYNSEDHALVLLNFDAGQKKILDVFANQRAAQLHDLTNLELADKFANNEAPLKMPPLDGLMFILHSLRYATETVVTRYYRMISDQGPMLVCSNVVKVLNDQGQLKQVRQLMRVVTVQEYDAMATLHPRFSPLAATGDRRGGRQLLADADADAVRPLSALLDCPEGLALLDRLIAFARSSSAAVSAAAAARAARRAQITCGETTGRSGCGGWVVSGGEVDRGPKRGAVGYLLVRDGAGGAGVTYNWGAGCHAAAQRIWWAGPMMARYSAFGYRAEGLAAVLEALPQRLLEALDTGVCHLRNAMDHLSSFPQPPKQPSLLGAYALPDDIDAFAQVAEAEGPLWEDESGMPFVRVDFEPAEMRRKLLTASAAAARMYGIHPDEMAGRLGQRDLPLQAGQEDVLRILIFEIAKGLQDEFTLYHRIIPPASSGIPGAGAVLSCRTTRRCYDAFGRIASARHIQRLVTVEEYDEALIRNPLSCLHAATGDLRSGSQLLADAAADARRSIANMAAGRVGRARLNAMAEAAERLFARSTSRGGIPASLTGNEDT